MAAKLFRILPGRFVFSPFIHSFISIPVDSWKFILYLGYKPHDFILLSGCFSFGQWKFGHLALNPFVSVIQRFLASRLILCMPAPSVNFSWLASFDYLTLFLFIVRGINYRSRICTECHLSILA